MPKSRKTTEKQLVHLGVNLKLGVAIVSSEENSLKFLTKQKPKSYKGAEIGAGSLSVNWQAKNVPYDSF